MLSASELNAFLTRERDLADRGTRLFCLIVLRERGRRSGVEGLRRLAPRLRKRLRSTDLVGWLDQERLCVLLTDTEPLGARIVGGWVGRHADELAIDIDATIYVYPTVAEANRPEDDDDPHGDGSSNGNGSARSNASANGHGSANSRAHEPPARRVSDVGSGWNGVASKARESVSTRDLRAGGHADGHRADRHRANGHRANGHRANGHLESHYAEPHCDWPMADLWPELSLPMPLWKRTLDVCASAFALVLLLPLFALVAIAIKLDTPGPVIFKQQRAGRGGRPFTFYKFRSMGVDAEQRRAELQSRNEQTGPVFKMRADPRVTRVGRILRRWSIDELPQLWNIFKGDISLVGPRSPTFDEVVQYERWQRRRLNITGGVTCYWQVSGRSQIGFSDWMRMDRKYIERRCLALDLWLLSRTLPAVVSGRGAC